MEGCVPDSIRYVPGLRFNQVNGGLVAPAATSVENDCTRGPCCGGVPSVVGSAIGHVVCWALAWFGAAVNPPGVPRPPPNWPTITSEVGTGLGRPFVRLMVNACPAGTVITTGDHPAGVVAVAAGAAGFRGRQPGPVSVTVPQV